MSTRSKACFLIAPMLLVSVGLVLLTRRMFPFRPGNSPDFWLAACAIKLDPDARASGGYFYPPRDGWVVYYLSYPGAIFFHGEVLYRVRLSDVVSDLDRVLDQLNAAPEGSLPPYLAKAHNAWLAGGPRKRHALSFLDGIREARLDYVGEDKPRLRRFYLEQEDYFCEQWRRSKFYVLNFAFEWIFLNSLGLLAFWPWLFNRPPWRWGVHVGLLPILLLTPWFLGYSPTTFTSIGPQGGVLYPWVIAPLRYCAVPWTSFDNAVVDFLPRLLDPLNQMFSQPASWTGMGAPSPRSLLGLGFIVGVITFALRLAFVKLRKGAAVAGGDAARPPAGGASRATGPTPLRKTSTGKETS